MKRIYFLLCMTLIMLHAVAQTKVTEVKNQPEFIYGTEKLSVFEIEDNNFIFRIFNTKFEEEKRFSIPRQEYYSITQKQKRKISGYIEGFVDEQEHPACTTVQEFKEEIEFLNGIELKQVVSSNNKDIYLYVEKGNPGSGWNIEYCYYEYEKYGKKYPERYFRLEKKQDSTNGKPYYTPYFINVWTWEDEYMGEWETEYTDTTKFKRNLCDDNFSIRTPTATIKNVLTASIFDDNADTYEFVISHCKQSDEFKEKDSWNDDRDGNGIPDVRYMVKGVEYDGHDIYSDGVQTGKIYFDGAYFYDYEEGVINAFLLDNAIYFSVEGEYYLGESYRYYNIYRYDKESTAVEKVNEYKVPSIRKRENLVEIELNGVGNNSKIVISNMSGQICETHQIADGTSSVSLNTSSMKPGIYNFTVYSKDRIVENGKIVIR